jgi:hypothetical protein
MRKAFVLAWLILAFVPGSKAQETLALEGYISDMQTLYHLPENEWLWENNLHNRLNLSWYPANWLTGSIQLRSRLITGKHDP